MAKNNLSSPGVQVTEKDLTLRANFTPGTNIVVPGFAPQGPTVEPIFISTASELETIFGVPTTPAERYFYYSCRQIIDSPGNLIAMRLPYGTATGSGFSQKYAGLFYPAATADNDSRIFPSTTFSSVTYGATTLSAQCFVVEVSSGLVKAFYWGTGGASTEVVSLTGYNNSLNGGTAVDLGTASTFAGMITGIANNIGTSMTLASTSNSFTLTQKTFRTSSVTSSAVGGATAGFVAGGTGVLKTEWKIQAPIHKELSESQYNNLKNGNFEWQTPSSSGSDAFLGGTSSAEISSSAGFFVVNALQTSINEIGEGYYFGFADNSALYVESPDFVSINKLNTIVSSTSSTSTYSQIKNTRIDFKLSATSNESIRGVNSVSETLEKVGFVGFESDEYQDYLSLGLFRVRRSTSDAVTLTLGTTETFLGSFDYNRKRIDPNGAGGNLPSSFVEEVVNDSSSQIKIFVNPALSRKFSWAEGGSVLPTNRITVDSTAKGLFPIGAFEKIAVDEEKTKVIGEVPEKLDKAFRMIENPETLSLDLILDAGLSTVYSTTKVNSTTAYFDDSFVSEESFDNLYLEWKTVADQLVTFSEKTRKDCMSIIDVPRPFFVSGKDQKVAEAPDKNFQTSIYNPLRQCIDPIESNYAAAYANWIKLNDLFTGKKFWLPFSGVAGSVYAYNDRIAYPWSAPAGLNRGLFNCLDIALNPNQKQRDRLYEIAVNPVAYFAGDGFAVMGQKTLQNKPTAFDRVNVRRLFLALERATQRALKYFVFEPNTEFTRTRLKNVIAPLFEYAKNTEGLYDYLLVCDARNNLPDTIDNNELIVDIYLKPVRTAEFILVNFIATRTGQNFSELI